MTRLPSGEVTFLFTDVEGSTKLIGRDPQVLGQALGEHHDILKGVVEQAGGVVFETVGDAVFAAFAGPADAVRAAIAGQQVLASHPWSGIAPLRVRMALDTGQVERRDRHYFGEPLFRCARIQSLGHGEQVLLSSAAAAATEHQLPAGATLNDLGSHRLRDLTSIERVFQLVAPGLRTDFPPLRSLGARPHNLPSRLPPLIGRGAELAAAAELLEAGSLVTLVGTGGIGKTRLALGLAADSIERFRDGVFFVDLAPALTNEVATSAIATVLGLRDSDRGNAEALVDHLRGLDLLLVLDNLEQLPEMGTLVARILAVAPGIKVLATSRMPVGVQGERQYHVPGLALPTDRSADESATLAAPAVSLFAARAREADPGLVLDAAAIGAVVEICRRLDGLPLAIELAAAWIRALPPIALLARLDRRLPLLTSSAPDRPDRHRTLRATIAWSVDLLAAGEAAVFRRLSPFVGGIALSAAEAVLQGFHDGAKTLDHVAALVDRSLLQRVPGTPGDARYSMLETIREYALDDARQAGELEAAREQHFRHFFGLAEQARLTVGTESNRAWLDRLEVEHDNIRAALGWLDESGRERDIVEMVAACGRFWARRGHAAEGRRWVQHALRSAGDDQLVARARIQLAAWAMHLAGGDGGAAYVAIREAAQLFELGGSEAELAYSLAILGEHERATGRYDEARLTLVRAVEIADRCRNDVARIRALNALAQLALVEDDVETGRRELERSFQESRRLHDLASIEVSGCDLANLLTCLGEFDAALEPARAAVEAARRGGDADPFSLGILGTALASAGPTNEARAVLTEALEAALSRGSEAELVSSLEGWTVFALASGDPALAALLLAATVELRSRTGYVAPPYEVRFSSALEAQARAALSTVDFERAQARGRSAGPEDVAMAVGVRLPTTALPAKHAVRGQVDAGRDRESLTDEAPW